MDLIDYRVGLGFDLHRFTSRKKGFFLGGVKILVDFGIEAVSDGDVILHAISDALCGVANLGDIGDYFPPSAKFKNLKSKKILNFILNKIKDKIKICNLDIIIIAEKPPLVDYKEKILLSLKKILSLDKINIKIKSKERTNFFGGKNSIVCFALVLVKFIKNVRGK